MKRILTILTSIIVSISLCVSCAKEVDVPVVGGIYGVITNANTFQPIQGANVVLAPTNISTVTGADGTFNFIDLEPQTYKMTVVATGYNYNSRQVKVIAGQKIAGDVNLTPEEQTTGFSLTPSVLAFGSKLTELTFTVANTGNSSATNWNISGIDAAWLTVSPTAGSTAVGESSAVKVFVNRSYVTSDEVAYFIVNAGGGSKQILVSVSPTGGSGEDPNGGGDNPSTDGVAATAGLWAYYNFDDESMNDSWENQMNGNFDYTPKFSSATPNGSGKALIVGLNNDNQWVKARIPYNPFKNKTEYSYAFWVKNPTQGLLMNAYGYNTDNTPYNYPTMSIADNKLRAGFASYSIDDYFDYNPSTVIQSGEWTHIAVSVKKGEQILYINGVRTSTQQSSVGSSESSEIHFGGSLSGRAGAEMTIDNIRIYTKTITPSDVTKIYNSEK